VQDLLLTVARDHLEVLTAPEPAVTFDEFAAANLRFTLYAFVGDIAKSGKVRTELAIAIIEAFAQAGIAIPSGQSEIAIRKMDWLREIISESVSVPAEKRFANGGNTSTGAAPAQPLQG
jgi:small-conductance mechanosensitive channel